MKTNKNDKRQQVFKTLKKFKFGATAFQIAKHLNWPLHCVSGRLSELNLDQKIFKTSKRLINPKTKVFCIVWQAL